MGDSKLIRPRCTLAFQSFLWRDSSMPRYRRRMEIEPAAVEADRLAEAIAIEETV